MWGDRVDADIRVRLLNNQWRQRLGMRRLKRPLITRYLASKEQKSIVLATRHLFWCGKNSFMLQTFLYKLGKAGEIGLWTESYIESFSEKQEHLPSTLPVYEYPVGALHCLCTNIHKHSHILIYFSGLVIQQISYCFVEYNCRSTSFSSLYSLSSALVVLVHEMDLCILFPLDPLSFPLKLLRW